MESETHIDALKKAYETYLNKHSGRKNLYQRAGMVIVNEKSKVKRLCLTIAREIFEDDKKACCLFLKDKELSDKLIKLLTKGLEEEIEFEDFKTKFFGLSQALEFIFKISEYYSIFSLKFKEEYCGENISLFLFEKKFKDEYINCFFKPIGIEKIKITFNNFIEKIMNNKFDRNFITLVEIKKIFFGLSENKENILSEKKVVSLIENNEAKKNIYTQKNESEKDTTSEISKNGGNGDVKKIINKISDEENIKSKNEHSLKTINDINSAKLDEKIPEENFSLSKEISIESNKDKIEEEIDSKENNDISDIKKTNEIEIITKIYKVFDYLKQKYSQYKKKLFIPVLAEIIKNKSSFSLKNIGYYNKKIFFPLYKLNDKILSVLLDDKLNIFSAMENKEQYGYFVFDDYIKNKNVQREGLYSIIDPINLFNFCKVESEGVDYHNPDMNLYNLYIKSRAMTLEYYINHSIFSDKYKVKHYPRIIYPLKKEKSNEIINEIEIDGAFFVDTDFQIADKDFPFIFQHFLSFSNSNKTYKLDSKYKAELNGKEFKKNDLCLLEIKTKFPDGIDSETLPEVINKMLSKMYVFEQLFKKELGINYERIRLILFYDLAKLKNYEVVIKKELDAFYKENYKLDYINKICFQVIYINSSFFVESLITNSDRINNLEGTIKELKKELEKRDKKIIELQAKNNELQTKNNELQAKNNELLEKIDSGNKEYVNLQKKIYDLIYRYEKKLSDFEEKLKSITSSKEPNSKQEKNDSQNAYEKKANDN